MTVFRQSTRLPDVNRSFPMKSQNKMFWPYFTFPDISGGGGYSHILAIQVCAAGKGLVFKPFSLV